MLHAPFIGTFLAVYPVIKVYWWAWMGIWIGLVLWRLLNYFNVGKARYKLEDKQTLATGITRYTLMPLGRKLLPKPGQFMYVRGFFFSEMHPFSVMEFDESIGSIAFGIKQVGKYTRQLETIPVGSTVYLDGPYGLFTREGQNSDPKVIIAGGIGITPFVELIRRFAGPNTYLIYANRSLDMAVKRQEFKDELKDNYIDVISDDKVTNEPVILGIIDEKMLQQSLPPICFKSSRFFLCGPPPFMAAVQKNLLKLGVDKSCIYIEEFSL
jgi:3-phenylpropionate/trans-cinnamate dioxygenase ferredoxin reductase subunit